MWTAKLWMILLLSAVGLRTPAAGRQCGFPGRPRNGTSATAAPVSRPGDTAHYTCRPGYTLFGEDERVCLDSGIWTGRQPLCDSYQEFTIFIIQLLSRSEALYKPCATFKGRFQNPRILFTCNDGLGHQGRYVYIRDDRRDQDYFGLCEVEVFAYRDESICGEPEEPVAGHVVVGSDGVAIYSCDFGYRLLAEPNRTCERDGHWMGHAPQCEEIVCDSPPTPLFGFLDGAELRTRYPYNSRVRYRCRSGYIIWGNTTSVCTELGIWSGNAPQCKPITCGYPQHFPNSEVQLLNQSTLWNTLATYTCKAGYSFNPGIVDVTISCLSSGSWEKINFTCVADDDRNLPVKLTGKEWGQQPEQPGSNSEDDGVGMPGVLSIGIFCSLLVIILSVLGILLAKRFQSKKATHSTPQSSTNDLIISNAKDGTYDDVATPGFQTVVALQPQCSAITREDAQTSDVLPYFTQTQEPTCYDTLQSFPSVSSYNSTVVIDTDQDPNNTRIKRGDADGEGAQTIECMHETPRQPLSSGYETVCIQRDSDYPIIRIPEYEMVRNLQQMPPDSTYEIVQPNGAVGSLGKSKSRMCRSIPSALKIFLQPSSKPTESELCDGAVPAEIMALYAQVDKTKKRKYRPDMHNNFESNNHKVGNHVSSQTDECGYTEHPISDIVRFSQDSCGPGVWNGNSKGCTANMLQDCRVSSPNGRLLSSVPNIRFIHTSQDSESPNQTLECAQL
ncbi:uncharacterized protein LOC110833660 isoform X3 [Zootermopsis nevadensis]|uniref:uncharacterized protein LOC110833660 isoform X3 n=1 Tax=Zootermopsis nevadensis TaxID=136037 RepID=UPI000B8E818C|nr:uncharacterized protein LOC110833660 isoform X3 [Zootermopsis nevadensis]